MTCHAKYLARAQIWVLHTRVGYLIDGIENSDVALQAAIANIRQNTNGMRDDFEKAAAVLLPVDPFEKNSANKKTVNFQISALGKANQFGRGENTGVDLRWYKPDEYAKLTPVEKIELNAWQRSEEGKKSVATDKKAFHKSKKRSQENDDASTSKKKSKTQKKAAKQTAEIAAKKKSSPR